MGRVGGRANAALPVALPVFFTQAARAEVTEAQDWCEAQAAGLGVRFRSQLDAAVQRIASNPLQHPVVFNGDVRRALVRDFPYSLFFRTDLDAVVVVACFHASRARCNGSGGSGRGGQASPAPPAFRRGAGSGATGSTISASVGLELDVFREYTRSAGAMAAGARRYPKLEPPRGPLSKAAAHFLRMFRRRYARLPAPASGNGMLLGVASATKSILCCEGTRNENSVPFRLVTAKSP